MAELLFKSGHSIEDTQRGIVFIDEIDKIARRSQGARNGAGSRDIGGEGVQQALLKLLEGREIFVPLNVTQHWNKHDFVQVDTSDILFICAGTFSDLHRSTATAKTVGFGGAGAAQAAASACGGKELADYGMLPELLGRLPVHGAARCARRGRAARACSPSRPIRWCANIQALLALDDVSSSSSEGALREVVRFAVAQRLGARGLRGILEEVCPDLMFEAPEQRGERIHVDRRYALARLKNVDAGAL